MPLDPSQTFCVGYLMDNQCNIQSLADLLPSGTTGEITVGAQTIVGTTVQQVIQKFKSLPQYQQWLWLLIIGAIVVTGVSYGRRKYRRKR